MQFPHGTSEERERVVLALDRLLQRFPAPSRAERAGFLEAQYELGPGYLIITSQDCPFEESNDFVLLDRQFRQIAHRQLLVWYETFLLNAHWPVADDALVLHYQQTLFFRLSVKRRRFGIGYRLGLRHIRRFEDDPRMKESVNELRKRLLRHQFGDDLEVVGNREGRSHAAESRDVI